MTAHDGWSPPQGIGSQWSDIPTAFLKAELARRAEPPTCGTKGARESYNTPLHVAALVIILVLSTLACGFPVIVRHFPGLPVPHHFLFLSRHFGTGVLIATAFVHLLPTAFTSLTDPCLPSFWNEGYPAMPGLIAMMAVLVVVGIEMFFAAKGAGHVHGSDYDTLGANGGALPNGTGRPKGHVRSNSFRGFREHREGSQSQPPHIMLEDMDGSTDNLMAGRSPSLPENSPRHRKTSIDAASDEEDNSDLELDELDPVSQDSSVLLRSASNAKPSHLSHRTSGFPSSHLSEANSASEHAAQKKLLLQCVLLEAGILFHSVFIGMALSVATGTPFIVLLIAISFHQTFEGLALGSRISAVRFPDRSPQPWLMALAYGTTTPVGQAIGLLIHNLYDPASQTGLLMVGTMNAISSGLLLFAGLVELLAEDFLSDESYETLTGRRRLEACGAVVAGAALMALVGAWA